MIKEEIYRKNNVNELDDLARETRIELLKNNKDINEAIKIWEELAKKGSLEAKYYIAVEYYTGKSVEKDIKRAVNLFKELEKENFIQALSFLGECYYLGICVEKNYKMARKILESSEDYSNIYTNPKFYLGEIYFLGRGIKKDYKKAKKYFEDVNEQFFVYTPYRLYYYLGLITDNEEKRIKKSNYYFNLIEEKLLYDIYNQFWGINTIKDLYIQILKYKYDYFLELIERDENLTKYMYIVEYLNEEELKERIQSLKMKLEKCMFDPKFSELYKTYIDSYGYTVLNKIISESFYYVSIYQYIKEKIKARDCDFIEFIGQLYLDGIVVEKDEIKGNKYKKMAQDIRKEKIEKLDSLFLKDE